LKTRPAFRVARGNADFRRGGAPPAPGLGARGPRRRGGRGPPRGLPRQRGDRPVSAIRRVLRLGLLLGPLAPAVAVYLYRRLEHPPAPAVPGSATIFFPYGTPTSEIFRRLA